MKKFIAEESFWNLFPQASIGIIVAHNMKSSEQISDTGAKEIAQLLRDANEGANQYLTSNIISENAPVRVWRQAYQKFKTKKGARCSVENLLKRVLKDNPVGSITPSVDVYNAISLKYAFPVGGEDIDSFVGDFKLGVTEGGLDFLPIGEEEQDPTLPGELCYYDEAGAVCRCWNWRDGQRSALTENSKNAILVMECIEPERIGDLKAALDEFAQIIERYFGTTPEVKAVVDRDHPELIIET